MYSNLELKRTFIQTLYRTKTLLIILLPFFILGTLGMPSFQYALSQVDDSNGNSFAAYDLFGGLITVEIPEDWTVSDNQDGSVVFCTGATRANCEVADAIVLMEHLEPDPGKVFSASTDFFNSLVQEEEDNGLKVENTGQGANDNQYMALFSTYDSESKQTEYIQGIYEVTSAGHLFVSHFISDQDDWSSFLPIFNHIVSTWRANVNNGLSQEEFSALSSLGSKIITDHYCSNMDVVDNFDVNKGNRLFKIWDYACQKYR